MPVLTINNISKTFAKHKANDNINFEVSFDTIFGLLGPNGAGKTTLIRIITNIFGADSGEVLLDGKPLNKQLQNQIGYMPEERGLYKKMKVGEHLIYLARLRGLSKKDAIEKIHYWLKKFNIEDWWDKKVEDLSKGMQQKIQFIATVVHEPKLLILDEPFSGLDPINTNLIKNEIYELHNKGTGVIFSTHRMEQVEEICDEIVLINDGKVILQGNVKGIKQQFKANQYAIEYEGELTNGLLNDFEVIKHKNNYLQIQLKDGQNSKELMKSLLQTGVNIIGFNEILPSINEIFIKQVEG